MAEENDLGRYLLSDRNVGPSETLDAWIKTILFVCDNLVAGRPVEGISSALKLALKEVDK